MSDLDVDSVLAITRKDFHDAVRSRALLFLTAVFVVFFTASAYFWTDLVGKQARKQGAQLTSDAFLQVLSQYTTTILIPLIALVVAYASIVGERESGTLKLLLSLPHSRLDVVVGKVTGRSAVVALPVLVGFVGGMLVFPFTPVELAVGNYVLFALLTALLGVVFVGVAVGVSAAASSSRQAVVGVVGLYVLLTIFWNTLASSLAKRLAEWNLITEQATRFKLQLLLKLLNPTQAYKTLATRLGTETALQARLSMVGNPFLRGAYEKALGDSLPFYLSDAAAVAVILLWLVVPPALGYLVFVRRDL